METSHKQQLKVSSPVSHILRQLFLPFQAELRGFALICSSTSRCSATCTSRCGEAIDMAAQAFQGVLSNGTCQLCAKHNSAYFCTCTHPPTQFCMSCLPNHHSKYPRAIHQVVPIVALARDIEEYKGKYESLVKGADMLRRNVEQIDQFSREFDDLVQTCVNYLAEYRAWWLQRMQAEKQELLAAIEAGPGL